MNDPKPVPRWAQIYADILLIFMGLCLLACIFMWADWWYHCRYLGFHCEADR